VKMLVTGADGFVGRWLIRRLLADGREVWGAVRPAQSPAPVAPATDLTAAEREAVRWLPLELTDAESVRRASSSPTMRWCTSLPCRPGRRRRATPAMPGR
jgi:nucleoside-diphosphate-sugar epimerase